MFLRLPFLLIQIREIQHSKIKGGHSFPVLVLIVTVYTHVHRKHERAFMNVTNFTHALIQSLSLTHTHIHTNTHTHSRERV